MEYLLLIAGALLIAVIVITLLISLSNRNSRQTQEQVGDFITDEKVIPPQITKIFCTSDQNYSVAISENKFSDYNYLLYVDGDFKGQLTSNPWISYSSECLPNQTAVIIKTSLSSGGSAASTDIRII